MSGGSVLGVGVSLGENGFDLGIGDDGNWLMDVFLE
jgi:hypothetical protein